jgi:ASC-1-like (ASCH) protein
MPLLYARKEVFQALKEGKKTIDVRKGKPRGGEFAVFQCGPEVLKLRIVGVESGLLSELVRGDNFLQFVPWAGSLGEALEYVHGLYPDCSGVFTAYHLETLKC